MKPRISGVKVGFRAHSTGVAMSQQLLALLVSALLVTAVLSTPSAYASVLEQGGTGARQLGFGGAGAAAATGAAAVYDNPALLASLGTAQALIGATALRYDVTIARGGGAGRWPTVPLRSLTLGTAAVAVPLTDRLGVGLLVHLPVSGSSRLLSFDHRRPQLPLWQGLGERLAIAGSVGFRLTDRIAIGFTGHVAADLDARASFDLSLAEGAFTRRDLAIRLRNRIVPALAVQAQITTDLQLMLRWRGAYEVTYAVPLQLNVVGVGPVALEIAGTGLLSPEVVTLAGVYQLRASVQIVASLRYERWSQLPPLSPRISVIAGGTPPWLQVYADPPAPGAVDIWVAQTGVNWRLTPTVALRCGLGFRPTPLPRASGAASWLDSRAMELAAGGSWRATPRLEVDIGARWSHLLTRRVAKANPDDPIGFTQVSGDIFLVAVTLRPQLSSSASHK